MRPRTPCARATRPTGNSCCARARSAMLATLASRRLPLRLLYRLAGALDQLRHRAGRTRAELQPVLDAVGLEVHPGGLGVGIVGAHLFGELAVARVARVGRDHVVERRLLRAPAREAQLDGHRSAPLEKRGCVPEGALRVKPG